MTQTSQATTPDIAIATEHADAAAARDEHAVPDCRPEHQQEVWPVPHTDATRESCRARTPCASAECQIQCFLLALGLLCAMFLVASVVGPWLASNLMASR